MCASQIECHFLDVGQGSCSIVLLGERRGLVVDLPQSKKRPLRFLRDHVDTVEVLALTHNDRDHANGFIEVYEHYRGGQTCCINTVALLCDRPRDELPWQEFIGLLKRDKAQGKVGSVTRLESGADEPKCLWKDPSRDIAMDVLYPCFLANMASSKPNQTSAILRFRYGSSTVLFTGDAPYEAFDDIHRILGGPIQVDIVTVPHHGGLTVRGKNLSSALANTVSKVYDKHLSATYAVISVGTSRPIRYGHPVPTVVRALRHNDIVVLCTQVTANCADDLEALRPGIMEPTRYSRSTREPETTAAGRSANVACASTVVAVLRVDDVELQRLADHKDGVCMLSAQGYGHPLCVP